MSPCLLVLPSHGTANSCGSNKGQGWAGPRAAPAVVSWVQSIQTQWAFHLETENPGRPELEGCAWIPFRDGDSTTSLSSSSNV